MERYINRLFVMFIAVSISLFTASCSDDSDEEIGNNDANSTVTNVTLNGVSYTTTNQSHYYIDPVEGALGFGAVLKSDDVEEPIMFILYYPNWDLEERKITDGKELNGVNIAIKKGAGSISGGEAMSSYTEILSGNIIAVPYEGGHGLEFNNLKFTTSYNSGQTFTLNGTVYYKYKILDNPVN